MRLSLSPLTGQQYILLKNPDQYLEEEEWGIIWGVAKISNIFVFLGLLKFQIFFAVLEIPDIFLGER